MTFTRILSCIHAQFKLHAAECASPLVSPHTLQQCAPYPGSEATQHMRGHFSPERSPDAQ
jgi:hypothetical protein